MILRVRAVQLGEFGWGEERRAYVVPAVNRNNTQVVRWGDGEEVGEYALTNVSAYYRKVLGRANLREMYAHGR